MIMKMSNDKGSGNLLLGQTDDVLTSPVKVKKCPECKSDDIYFENDHYACLRCGHTWDT